MHSLFSHCGLHTVLELIAQAKVLGMEAIAITDHGPTMKGRLTSVFFERFRSPDPSIRVLKGIECNLMDGEGTIDAPGEYLPFLDIILLGIHPNTKRGLSREEYTDMLVKAIRKNPMIDIITHPNDPVYPVDYLHLAKVAAMEGVAVEINNSKVLYSRCSVEEAELLIAACKEAHCRIAVNSDTHAVHELGDDSAVAPLLARAAFPAELIVNRDMASAMEFIETRRRFKVLSAQ